MKECGIEYPGELPDHQKGVMYNGKNPVRNAKKGNGLFEKRFTVNGKRYSAYGHTVKECADNETELASDNKGRPV